MAKSCQDVSARMLELIYGELGDDERAALEAHIAGCPDCRAEREGFERTRAVARQVLDEPAPARARAAILAAAAQAVAARPAAAAATAATAAPAPVPARAPRPPERRSFWDWVRTRWTLPTLATVGAVAVLVLGSRVFLNPEKTVERGREVLAPTPPAEAPAAKAPAAEAPAGATARPAETAADNDRQAATAPPLAEEKLAGASRPAETETAAKQLARRDEKPAAHRMRAGVPDDGVGVGAKSDLPRNRLDALIGADKSAARGDGLAGLAGATDGERAALKNKDGLGSAAARGGSGAAYGVGGVAKAESRAFAPPPPPATAPAKAASAPAKSAATATPPRPAKKEVADEPFAEPPPARAQPSAAAAAAPAAQVAPPPQAAPPPPAAPRAQPAPSRAAPEALEGNEANDLAKAKPKSRKRAPEPAPAVAAEEESPAPRGAAESAQADEAPAPRAENKTSAGKGRAPETAAQRADRLFAEGHWIEAAAAYRDLLRDDPRNRDADRWRKRLALAQAEIAAGQRESAKAAAKASKAEKATDATH